MAAAVCAASLLSSPAQAAQKVCVYDFIGASGDLFNMVRDYALAMQRDGVFMELKGYNDEAAALEAYKSGQCDGFVGTAFRSRQFNAWPAPSTLSAPPPSCARATWTCRPRTRSCAS